jgi:lipoprotein NlpI
MRYLTPGLVWLSLILARPCPAQGEETAKDLRDRAQAAWNKSDRDRALQLATQAIAADRSDPEGYLLRGKMFETMGKHEEAVKDFKNCIIIDPKRAEAYNHLGSELFKLGKVKESVSCFDKYLAFNPKAFAGHWKRGISLYYVGRFEEGRKQFEGYQTLDANDVENAVWHFLCVAKKDGLKKARAALLPIRKDSRVPMMEVYALFQGKIGPARVLKAARAGEVDAQKRKQQLFYAHLYLGLFFDATGNKKEALKHLTQAAGKYRISHYMGDVARVHLDLLK